MHARTPSMWALLLLAVAAVASAAGPGAVRKQAEMSMLVTGYVLVEPDGRVSGWEIDQREKLPDYVVNLVENSAPAWKFEPVLVDGQPRKARARMSLRMVANRLDDGDYRIAIRNGYFGEDAMDAAERKALADSDRVRSAQMRPPMYPMQALNMGVQGTVYLVLRIDRQGAVADVAVEQVNLRVVASENEMRRMRDLLSKPAVVAARKWTFTVPITGEDADAEHWSIRVPVDYAFSNTRQPGYGEWQVYIPGPHQPAPWTRDDLDAGRSPDAMIAGEVYEIGKGLKLLTPLQSG